MTECGAREPGGVLRCDEDKGHRGHHGAQVDVVGGEVRYYWPSHRKERQQRLSRTRMDKQRTGKQQYRQGRLAGIRDERLAKQRLAFAEGTPTILPGAVVVTGRAPGPNWCEHCGQPTPAERLQLHHYVHRSLGKRATPEDQGDERPSQLGLICQGPGSCHDEEHA